ncbi:hypothetical protein V6Z11_A08G079800 [Gossypium hirsutum]
MKAFSGGLHPTISTLTKDRIIETYIHNLSATALRVIEQHLQEAGFMHLSRMLGRLNWSPHLSTLCHRILSHAIGILR